MTPALISPSPSTTYVRRWDLSMRAPSAMPAPIATPWPRGPAGTSTPGVFFGSGWPCRRLFNALKVTSSSTGRNPRWARTVYGMAQAWPLENTNLSRPPIGVCRVQPQLMKVERRQDFGRGKRPANVPGAPAVSHAQHLNATFVRAARQIADHLRTVLRA